MASSCCSACRERSTSSPDGLGKRSARCATRHARSTILQRGTFLALFSADVAQGSARPSGGPWSRPGRWLSGWPDPTRARPHGRRPVRPPARSTPYSRTCEILRIVRILHCAACIPTSPPLCAQVHRPIMTRSTSQNPHALGSPWTTEQAAAVAASSRSRRRRGSRRSSSRRSSSRPAVVREATARHQMAAVAGARLHALGSGTGGDGAAAGRPLPPRYSDASCPSRCPISRVPDLFVAQDFGLLVGQ